MFMNQMGIIDRQLRVDYNHPTLQKDNNNLQNNKFQQPKHTLKDFTK